MSEGNDSPLAICPKCSRPLATMKVRTAIWQQDKLAVIEDIPALVCDACTDQYYDDDVSEAIRRLNEAGFPRTDATRIEEVPIFSLEGRIRKRKPIPEDSYVD